ncbi:hypothetical protein CDA63_14535 [Hymenobacter amundsenii]|uniref:Uncharacterized protein n=1 Tax=Hymenobacter amundsenii TaxID=2006685 RepID=A0A246FIP6_9BACT|nr:hypothetical protein [Hymenobacter amundsenii]OWP62402.1 hypothetical protein CDA63_14535 [Hymenobacter amundsenii]
MRYLTRQKLRGGTRHLKRLMQQSLTAAPLSEGMLQRYGYDYEKLGLGLWHWHHRQPPQRVRQLAAGHLLVTFFDWQQQLRAQPEPFYLAIWLVEGADFAHNSQAVAGIGERRARYGGTFGGPDPAGPPLPPEYCQLPGADTLTWTTHPWETWLDALDYPTGWPAWAFTRPHYFHTAEDGNRYLLVQTSWVWVGQPADITSSTL